MTETLGLIGACLGVVLAVAGTVAGWIAVGRMRRWRREQQATLPLIHAELTDSRYRLMQQAFELERQADEVASRLETGGRDLAVLLLGRTFARLTGRTPGFWGQAVARVVVGQVGTARGG